MVLSNYDSRRLRRRREIYYIILEMFTITTTTNDISKILGNHIQRLYPIEKHSINDPLSIVTPFLRVSKASLSGLFGISDHSKRNVQRLEGFD